MHCPNFPLLRYGLLALSATALSACSSLDGLSNQIIGRVTPYKIDIVQGNFVSREQVQALQPGMSREQVREILGTPLLASIFHADRWDYVFTFKRQGVEPQSRRVTVFFKGATLERVEADPLPTEAEFVASLDSGRRKAEVPVLEATDLPNTPPLEAKPAKPSPAPNPPLPASYPDLEPAAQ
ncbi:MAG: hypothetical protein OHK0048_17200 [Rhodoferax sp.]